MTRTESLIASVFFASLFMTVYGCGNPPEKVSGSNGPGGAVSTWPIDQLKKCIGEGNYHIGGLTNMSQMYECSLACLEYGCAAINIHKTSDTTFECFILTRFSTVAAADNWACYYMH